MQSERCSPVTGTVVQKSERESSRERVRVSRQRKEGVRLTWSNLLGVCKRVQKRRAKMQVDYSWGSKSAEGRDEREGEDG